MEEGPMTTLQILTAAREVSAAGRYTREDADREAAIEPRHMSVEREPEPTTDRVMDALRSARTLIGSERDAATKERTRLRINMEEGALNGPAVRTNRELMERYDAVLSQIDAALATRAADPAQ
jgi:hypothetical protein